MLLLDTHVILWLQARSRFLSARAKREISRATRLLISPASCWELSSLVRSGQIALDRDVHEWVRDLLSSEGFEVAPLTPSAAVAAGLLGEVFGGDPADRFLYATAREMAVPFVTRDERIREFARVAGDVRTIW